MLKSVKTSFKETIIYSFGNIAVKVVGLILIPLYTNPEYFSVEDFGILAILEISGLVVTALMASALPQSLIRLYWDKNFRSNQNGVFFMALMIQIVMAVILCTILIPLSNRFSVIIFSGPEFGKILTLVVLSSAIQSVNNIINTLMRLQMRSMLYTITNLLKLTIVLSLTLYLVISQERGLEGIYIAQVIGNGFTVAILSGYAFRNAKPYFNLGALGTISSYGFPLLLANISSVALTVIDRFTLNSLTVLKSVALYTLAFKITSVIKLVLVDSMRLAIAPMIIRKMDSPDIKRFFSKILLYSSYVLMFTIVATSAYSYEIIKVLADSKEFWSAVSIVPILAFSIYFINLKDITVYGLHIVKKTRVIGIIVVFATFLGLILNILFIPLWDITGAAIATLLSQLIYWLVCLYFSQKVYYVPYEMNKIAILSLVGIILSFTVLLFNDMELLPRLFFKTILVLSFPFILHLTGFYEKYEINAIKGFIYKWAKLKNFRDNLRSLKNIDDGL